MHTPIADFVTQYAKKKNSRFHMPGHKGQAFCGCEAYDITEITGADSLYEAEGIIAESEKNASVLFHTQKTLFSTEGSSQCIRAMLYLAINHQKSAHRPYVIAGRNVHKAFLYAAALLDFDIVWLYPEEMHSLCSCQITTAQLEHELCKRKQPPAAVYLTTPDYLGGQLSIQDFADLCHQYHSILAVDNAHGAYLHFLKESMHPMELGADICCDSAHKTLPVLTGGAYLHISKHAPNYFCEYAKQAMALFGSTSPSYLTLTSLDLCNAYLAADYCQKLSATITRIEKVRHILQQNGWRVAPTDPLKLTVQMPHGLTGQELSNRLHTASVECEYADSEYIVFMITPENTDNDYARLVQALGINLHKYNEPTILHPAACAQSLSVREAFFARQELIPVNESLGRICGAPAVSCPPAIPIVVSGEVIDKNAIDLFEYYGITSVNVVRDCN